MQPQNREVGMKLMYYTISMFTVPIAVFYACHDHVFQGERLHRYFGRNPKFLAEHALATAPAAVWGWAGTKNNEMWR